MDTKKKFCYNYEMAGNASTVVLYTVDETGTYILLGKRKETSDAYPGYWCLPGGMLNAGTETMIGAAQRETHEEVGINIDECRFLFFFNDDEPGNDPRYKQVINLCYKAMLFDSDLDKLKAGDDIVDLKFVSINKVPTLAFRHNLIVDKFIEDIEHSKHYP